MKMPRAPPKEREAGRMGNKECLQTADQLTARRTTIAAAYRRGYAAALKDMRERQWEKKRRRQYFIMQKMHGIVLLALTMQAVHILDGDATIALLTVPLGLMLIFSRRKIIMNDYYFETERQRKWKKRQESTMY